MKKIEANLEQFKDDTSQDSDTSLTFPEEVNRTHRRPADLKENLGLFRIIVFYVI